MSNVVQLGEVLAAQRRQVVHDEAEAIVRSLNDLTLDLDDAEARHPRTSLRHAR
jgi:hypothetical protein